MIINVWLALSDTAQVTIKERLNWDEETEYTGIVTDRQHKLFQLMSDLNTVQKLFRLDVSGWTLWSLYFDFARNALIKIQAEFDSLAESYPNHFRILGAWRWDGVQISGYPVRSEILEFMPDIITYEDGVEISRVRPTEPSDINLHLGQSPRQF